MEGWRQLNQNSARGGMILAGLKRFTALSKKCSVYFHTGSDRLKSSAVCSKLWSMTWEWSIEKSGNTAHSDTVKPIIPPADLRSTTELDKTVLQHAFNPHSLRLHLINFLNCITLHFLITLGNHSWFFIYCSDYSGCRCISAVPSLILC